ncbi:Flagellar motor rotation protein MotB [hydrothermal vent metagenome]|uniref:Flagellar motor rotation protein MotB n=1 Tax=hydrothermal vent metagenome TaxID=652676 RepID=A0A3B1DI33_9ZZZZ
MDEIKDDPAPGVPEWVVTYGDMMSLLLTFFIMLVSMSELKQEGEVRAALDAMREAFGADMGESGVMGPSSQTTSTLSKLRSESDRSDGGVKKASRTSAGISGAYGPAIRINHGTTVTLGGASLFHGFEAALNDSLKKNIRIFADVIKSYPNKIVIRGHASPEPVPPNTPFSIGWIKRKGEVPDQMDLSFARAQSVANYLVLQGIDEKRLVITAAGDKEPRVRSRDIKRQQKNHRVDLFLIDSYISPPQ